MTCFLGSLAALFLIAASVICQPITLKQLGTGNVSPAALKSPACQRITLDTEGNLYTAAGLAISGLDTHSIKVTCSANGEWGLVYHVSKYLFRVNPAGKIQHLDINLPVIQTAAKAYEADRVARKKKFDERMANPDPSRLPPGVTPEDIKNKRVIILEVPVLSGFFSESVITDAGEVFVNLSHGHISQQTIVRYFPNTRRPQVLFIDNPGYPLGRAMRVSGGQLLMIERSTGTAKIYLLPE